MIPLNSELSKGASLEDTDLRNILQELQGLKLDVAAGAAALTKLGPSAIRTEDTLVSVMESVAGVWTNRTGVSSIVDLRATGTITVSGTPLVSDTITVNAKVYTFIAAATVRTKGSKQINIGVTPTATETAANIVAVVNEVENWDSSADVIASNLAGVVTITARVEGTAGNAITLAESATNIVVSGATLAGGSATGGISVNDDTTGNQVIIQWFDRRP